MMQEPKNNDTSSGLSGGDPSERFLGLTPKIGSGSLLTDVTFPLARKGVEFYVANPEGFEKSFFGELESTADKVDTAFQSIVNRMGDGAGLGASIRKNFTEAVAQVQLIGLDFKDVQETAEATLDVFKTNVTLSEDQYTNLLSTQEVTGVVAKDLLTGFRDSGMAIKDITKEMYNVTQIATSIGVNAKIVSAAVVSNLDKLNRYGFQNGVEGLAKMAAKASALRIDLSDTLDIADDLMDPEGAIELASTLQRLGTTSAALTDPLRLMDMAQNDVGALQEELAKMFSTYAEFSEENQRFEILPTARRELKQLERELGMPLGTIEKMAIGTKELDKKLSEISFGRFDVPRETQELIANMSMMNEDGEYTIKYIDEEGKAREETTAKFLEDFGGDVKKMEEALGRQKEEEGKSIEDKMFERAGAQLTSLQQIEAYNRAGASALGLATGGGEYGKQILLANEEIARDLNTGLSQNLGPNSGIATSMNKLADSQKKFIEVLQSDTATKEQKKEAAAKMAEGYVEVGGKIVKQAGTAVTAMATNVGETFGIEIPGVGDFMKTLGVTNDDLTKFNTTVSAATGGLVNFNGIISKITSSNTPAAGAAAGTTTTTGPTSSITPVQTVGSTPTTVQQVNQITSIPEQTTAENLLAPKVQEATEKGMSEALSYYSASPSLAVTIKKDETEGKRIQVPKKPEEIPTEANLVQQTNENLTEINQTETQQTTNLGNETNFNVLNEVFNTTNEELKDISVTNSTLLKTSTEAFDKSQSLITNTNTLLSQIQQSSTLVKSNNTVASTTTTTTISPTPAAAATTPEATVTKPETPKAGETKETKIEVKRASKEEVGLFGQTSAMTGPLKIKEEEEIEKRTEFVTKLTDAEIKRYEDKKKEQVTFTDFLNEENVVKRESTKISVDEQKIKSDSKNKQIFDEKSVNSLVSQRQDLVTKLTDAEIKYYEDKKKEQVTFTGFLNEENDVKRENTKISVNEQTINSDSKKQQIVDEKSVNSLVSERQNFVTSLSEQEIKNIEEQKKQQLSFFKFSDEEIKKQNKNQQNTINQSNFVSDIQSSQLQVANELNEKYKENQQNTVNQSNLVSDIQSSQLQVTNELNKKYLQRKDFVTSLSEQEISLLDQQNQRQLSFDELLNQETTSREEYVTAFKDIEKDKSVTSVMSTEDTKKINESEVSKKDERISKTASELHKKMSTLYDGVIDESEKSFVTAINDAKVLKTPSKPEDTTRKIDNKNLFGTEPSALGKYVATGKEVEPQTPMATTVNPELPKQTKVNLFGTEPSALGKYVATGKAVESVTAASPKSFTPEFNKVDEISTTNLVNQSNFVSDIQKAQVSVANELNEKYKQRTEFVTSLSEQEIKSLDEKNKEQISFYELLNEETSKRKENQQNTINQSNFVSDIQSSQLQVANELNENYKQRTEFVTQLSQEEIKSLDESNKRQLSFFKFSDEEIKKQNKNQQNTINQSNFVSDIQSSQLQVANELNENYKQRTDFVTQLSQEEISTLDQQNERQRSFDELLSQETTSRQEYVTALKDIEKDKSVTSVINAEDTKKINESEVSKKDERISKTKISKTVSELHKKMATLYDGVIDENEKSVVTAINDAEVLKTQTPEDTTRKIDNKNLFGTEPSALGKYVATGKAAEPVTPTVSKPFIPEFNKTDVDRSVTNFVNQVLPKSTGVNLFDTKPSALSRYVPTGKAAEPVTPTVFKPDIPKPTTGERTVVTETDFGFGAEVPTSVAEFKGAEDVINQFFTPEAIAAVATPPVENLDKKSAEYKEFMSTQNNNQTTTIGGEAKVKVEVTGIKDPTVERELIKSVRDSIINQMTFNYGTQQTISNAANMGSSNFGLTGSQTPGF